MQAILPASFHSANRRRLAKSIGDDAVAIIDTTDVLTRSGDFEYPFHPDPNFFYLTGITEPQSVLVLVPGHSNKTARELLFVSGTTEHVASWEGDRLTVDQANIISGVETVLPLDDLEPILDRILSLHHTVYLNTDESLRSHMTSPSRRRAARLREALPLHQLRSALPELNRQRAVKDPAEVEQIRQAISITGAGLTAAYSALPAAKHEYEVEAALTAEFIRRGAANSFTPIVASGANTTVIHYMKNRAPVDHSGLMLFDIGAEYNGYAADISRTVPASGRFTPRQLAVYDCVYRTQHAAIELHKPGTSVLEIDEHMRTLLTAEIAKLGLKSDLRQYYPHISHHLGLDVHDTGSARLKLEPGMVVTCEPGLYLREEGIGVRLEDDILITGDGCEVLSRDIPSDPDGIEKLIQEPKS